MFRIKHVIPTVAVVIASAGALAPLAQAQPDGLYPHVNPKTRVVTFVDPAAKVDTHRGGWLEHMALASLADQQKVAVTGRTTRISGGDDWTLPVMGALTLGFIIIAGGNQILVRRRGRLVGRHAQLAT